MTDFLKEVGTTEVARDSLNMDLKFWFPKMALLCSVAVQVDLSDCAFIYFFTYFYFVF